MGLDIGFVHQTRWGAPRACALWSQLGLYEQDIADGSMEISLAHIKTGAEDLKEDNPNLSQEAIEGLDAFVVWCEEYWRERGLNDEDAIPYLFYY